MIKKFKKNKFLLIAALHGNEVLGVDLMKKIETELPPKEYNYDWIIGNPKAFEKKTRFTESDLNRVAPGNIESKIYEEKRAAELVKLSSEYKFVIDLHGSISNCGIVTIIPYPTIQNLLLASIVGIKRNVVWYSKSSSKKGPITQFTKCPAIEIENGPQNNPVVKHELEKIILRFIKRLNSSPNMELFTNNSNMEFYVVYGKKLGDHRRDFEDFKLRKEGKESYYPFLSNQYPNIVCYKAKKLDIGQYLLYDSN